MRSICLSRWAAFNRAFEILVGAGKLEGILPVILAGLGNFSQEF
jgi:hypothetical protein